MDIEKFFISQFHTKYIGDDAALIDGVCYSKDAFFENIHFKKEWMSYAQVAKKAMLVNISDAVAMNATPLYALLGVAMPKSVTRHEAKELAKGFKEAARSYGIEIIGGDTIANTKLDITVTIISKAKRPLLRSGLKEGDLLAYTGEIGKSAKQLRRALRGGRLHGKMRFITPVLRQRFVTNASRLLHCGMDISDGLFSDLEKLSDANRLGFDFITPIQKHKGCSGEEYEMLVGFAKRDKKAIIRQAKRSRTRLNIFACAIRGRYKNICKRHHFHG